MVNTPIDSVISSIRHNRLRLNSLKNKNHNQNIEFPCGICNFEVKHNDKSILCSSCQLWIHIKCSNISVAQYKEFQDRNRDNPELIENESWTCQKCVLTERSNFIPFIHLNTNELGNMNSVDSMKLFELIPNEDILHSALHINEFNINNDSDNDIEDSTSNNINCKYYSCNDFYNLEDQKSFNILHSNVNGYVSHADNIHEFLSQSKKNEFDVICISETSLRKDDVIPDELKLAGYAEPFSTETISSKGGVTIFAKNSCNAFERADLKIQTKEFETVWIEINKKGTKNTIVGCVYRHPHSNNLDEFSEFITQCLTKLSKEM